MQGSNSTLIVLYWSLAVESNIAMPMLPDLAYLSHCAVMQATFDTLTVEMRMHLKEEEVIGALLSSAAQLPLLITPVHTHFSNIATDIDQLIHSNLLPGFLAIRAVSIRFDDQIQAYRVSW